MTRLIQNQQHLVKWVRRHEGTIDIAVAFWGKGAIKALGLDERTSKFRILLDISAGATNPAEVRALKKLPNATVKCVSRLHAKAYITSNEALIGSANASTNGLGLEGSEATRWHELGLLTNDQAAVDEAKSWFDKTWKGGEPVTNDILKQAEIDWKLRQKARPKPSVKLSNILDAALKNPEQMRNRGIFVVVTTVEMDETGANEEKELKEKTGQEPYFWQKWPKIPLDAKLISFSDYPDEGLDLDHPPIYYSPAEPNIYGSLTLVKPTEIPGFTVGRLKSWLPALERAKKASNKKTWEKDGMCWELVEFAELYGKE
jgi:HKD family nuclease